MQNLYVDAILIFFGDKMSDRGCPRQIFLDSYGPRRRVAVVDDNGNVCLVIIFLAHVCTFQPIFFFLSFIYRRKIR